MICRRLLVVGCLRPAFQATDRRQQTTDNKSRRLPPNQQPTTSNSPPQPSGLETDLHRLLSVGGASASVAIAGVVLPFAAGYGVVAWLGYPTAVAVFLGAALTATSVGITARVLSDLGHLKSDESQVILGAAVVDNILGLDRQRSRWKARSAIS